MKHSLKEPDINFNLLYLEYSECLFDSITAYAHKLDENSNTM